MSWEGYSQNFCEKGHFFNGTAGFDGEPTHCECGARVAVCNIVDDTNCDSYGEIPESALRALLLEPERSDRCNLGHFHVTKRAVYRIPNREELKKIIEDTLLEFPR